MLLEATKPGRNMGSELEESGVMIFWLLVFDLGFDTQNDGLQRGQTARLVLAKLCFTLNCNTV